MEFAAAFHHEFGRVVDVALDGFNDFTGFLVAQLAAIDSGFQSAFPAMIWL